MNEETETEVETENTADAFASGPMVTAQLINGQFVPINQSPAMLRQAEERTENDVKALNGQGCFNLVGGIIRQQLEDYRKLELAGVCKNGKVIVDKMPRKVNEGMTIPEARQVCMFLQDEGSILEWLDMMGVNLSPAQIRRKEGLNW